jgi:tetratricopeptide (TPR) repeat protein
MMLLLRIPRVSGGLVLGIMLVAVYSGVLSVPFQYDDFHSIVDNPHIRSLSNVPAFFSNPEMFSEDPRSAMYRPLVLLSYAVDYQLYEYDAGGFHWTNLILHTAATCLVALLALSITRNPGGAVTAGIVFGLHPVNTEAVAYVSSRSESMCAVFFLLAFYAYLRTRVGCSRRLLWMSISVTAYVAALLSKAVGITLPVVLLLYEMMHSLEVVRPRILHLCRTHWPYWLASVLYIVFVGQMVHQAVVESPVRGMGTQLWTQIKALTYYLKLLVIPYPLSVEHQFDLAHGFTEHAVIWGFCLLLSIAILFWFLVVRAVDRSTIFWLTWPFVALLPTLVIPLNVLVNEHRLYLPSIALAMVAAVLVARYWNQHTVFIGTIVAILVALFAMYDTARVSVWQSSDTLWTDAVGKGPGMPRPYIYRGDSLKESGKREEALQSYYAALRVNPSVLSGLDRVVTYNNIGSTLLTMGRSEEAIQAYQSALRFDSTYVKAREALQGLLAFKPKRGEDATSLHKQGLLALWNGQVPFAIACLQGALEIERSAGTLMALGTAYERDGNIGAAINAYSEIATSYGDAIYAQTASHKADSLSAVVNTND